MADHKGEGSLKKKVAQIAPVKPSPRPRSLSSETPEQKKTKTGLTETEKLKLRAERFKDHLETETKTSEKSTTETRNRVKSRNTTFVSTTVKTTLSTSRKRRYRTGHREGHRPERCDNVLSKVEDRIRRRKERSKRPENLLIKVTVRTPYEERGSQERDDLNICHADRPFDHHQNPYDDFSPGLPDAYLDDQESNYTNDSMDSFGSHMDPHLDSGPEDTLTGSISSLRRRHWTSHPDDARFLPSYERDINQPSDIPDFTDQFTDRSRTPERFRERLDTSVDRGRFGTTERFDGFETSVHRRERLGTPESFRERLDSHEVNRGRNDRYFRERRRSPKSDRTLRDRSRTPEKFKHRLGQSTSDQRRHESETYNRNSHLARSRSSTSDRFHKESYSRNSARQNKMSCELPAPSSIGDFMDPRTKQFGETDPRMSNVREYRTSDCRASSSFGQTGRRNSLNRNIDHDETVDDRRRHTDIEDERERRKMSSPDYHIDNRYSESYDGRESSYFSVRPRMEESTTFDYGHGLIDAAKSPNYHIQTYKPGKIFLDSVNVDSQNLTHVTQSYRNQRSPGDLQKNYESSFLRREREDDWYLGNDNPVGHAQDIGISPKDSSLYVDGKDLDRNSSRRLHHRYPGEGTGFHQSNTGLNIGNDISDPGRGLRSEKDTQVQRSSAGRYGDHHSDRARPYSSLSRHNNSPDRRRTKDRSHGRYHDRSRSRSRSRDKRDISRNNHQQSCYHSNSPHATRRYSQRGRFH